MSIVHGTCVIVGETGVLIRGPSGSGKSDLALRLMDRGALLVADDACEVAARDGALILRPPPPIAGRIEARGLGIVRVAYRPEARLGLIVDLAPAAGIERLPEAADAEIAGVWVPRMQVDPTHPSADAKVRLAVQALAGQGMIETMKDDIRD